MTRLLFPLFFLLSATAAIAAQSPAISFESIQSYGQRLEPGSESEYRIAMRNYGAEAHDVRVTIDVDPEATVLSFTGNPFSCAQDGTKIVCNAGLFSRDQFGEIVFRLRMPDRPSGGHVTTTAVLTAAEQPEARLTLDALLMRVIAVTTTADDGFGTLRDAIRDANVSCSVAQPCRIAFNIPPAELTDGVAVIRPQTPLPPISATVVSIDGRTQTAFGGDTNPFGPEVELSGERVASGDGIEFRAADRCDFLSNAQDLYSTSVAGLVVNGFPGAGIIASLPDRCFRAPYFGAFDNYLGTDATGTRAVPNERGVMSVGLIPNIFRNVLSGNRRSGAFVWDAVAAHIDDNLIGVGADGRTPLGNGASGVLVDTVDGGATVARNTIANNAEFGVAIARGRMLAVVSNSIYDNGLLGIDAGLDLVTPQNAPVLSSAKYDPVSDTTIITGRLDADSTEGCCGTFAIQFYATRTANPRGLAQAERLLGTTPPNANGHFDFAFAAKGDLTGQLITALTYRTFIAGFDTPAAETSELGNPIFATR